MDVRDLINLQEAYLKSVETQQLDEISPDLALKASKAADIKRGKLSVTGDKEGAAAKAAQAARLYKAQAAKRLNREEFEGDLFDYIIEYLVAEGYADTNKASLAIMANMSEEWRNSIIDEVIGEDAAYDRNRRRAAQRAQARNEARAKGQTGSVPGVGYVSPRPERATYTDSAGVVRHHTGARMPKD